MRTGCVELRQRPGWQYGCTQRGQFVGGFGGGRDCCGVGIGTAATYAGDAISYQFNLTPDQPSYQNAATAGAVAGAMSPLLLPLNTLGSAISGKVAVGIYNSLVAGTGAFGTTAMTNPGSSPELSAGIGMVGSLLGSGAQAVLSRPIGNAVDVWMQIFSGSAQSAIEQNQRRK